MTTDLPIDTTNTTSTDTVVAEPAGALTCIVSAKLLGDALGRLSACVRSRASLPILNNVLIEIDPDDLGVLRLSATDLDVGACIRVPLVAGTPASAGRMTAPARLLLEYVRTVGGSDVLLGTHPETNRLLVTMGRSSARIATMAASEYPTIPFMADRPAEYIATMTLGDLREMVALGGHAALAGKAREGRPLFTAIALQFQPANGTLTMVSADSFRLAYVTRPIASVGASLDEVKIVDTVLGAALRVFGKADDDTLVTLALSEHGNHVTLSADDAIVIVNTMGEAAFPKWRAIVPVVTEATTHLVVDRAALKLALRGVLPLARDTSNIVRMGLDTSTLIPQIVLSASDSEQQDSEMMVECVQSGTGTFPAVGMILNITFLMEALDAFASAGGDEAASLELIVSDPKAPVLLQVATEGHDGPFQARWADAGTVMMPMHSTR